MLRKRQVALAFGFDEQHMARCLHGVLDYARERGNWSFCFSPEVSHPSVLDLQHFPGDGIITQVETLAELAAVRRMNRPIVNISSRIRTPNIPRVTVDQEAVGRVAAEHLLERGLHRFAYYGVRGVWFSTQRGRGFVERIKRERYECSVLLAPNSLQVRQRADNWVQQLEQWLRTLSPPVGVMACLDARAAVVIDACDRLRMRVPDDLAVIGADNNSVTCELCHVPLNCSTA
jgi:LacI family transcriptional regulator